MTLPSYFVIAIGLFVRTLFAVERPTTLRRKAELPVETAASAKEPNQP